MSQASNQSLQFSIDETVWLRNGYEADEILSIALDPDITIEETSQYVAIKGYLRLTGEYKPTDSADETDRADEVAYRVVDEITETEDGTAFMEHNFPVDITIPATRVRSIEDVYVTVDALDYAQPNRGCIQLQADISISGLVNPDLAEVEESRDVEPSQVDEAADDVDDSYDPLETVSYEAYREPEEEQDTVTPEFDLKERDDEALSYEYEADLEDVTGELEEDEEDEEAVVIPFRNEMKPVEPEPKTESGFKQFKTETTEVSIGPKKPEVSKKPEVKKQIVPPPPVVEEPVIPATEKILQVEDEFVIDDGAIVEEEVVEEKKVVSRQDENALYLTKMLTQENERFTKMKVCIVQDGDNLETIAERYKVPVTNILRRNQLSTDRLDEGQVLYIPVKG